MRRPLSLLCALVAVALAGCGDEAPPVAPPADRFYFPTGVEHLPAADGPGTLLVASSNFDRRYDFGAVTALDLAGAGLTLPPYLGGTGEVGTEPLQIPSLNVPEERRVLTAPFAGIIGAAQPDAEGRTRLFVPTRSEGDRVYPLEWNGTALSCVGGDAANRDCTAGGLSLTEGGRDGAAGFTDGKPRAPAPYAAAVSGDEVWVTHAQAADSPLGTLKNRESFLFRTRVSDPQVTPESFQSIGPSPSSTVALGARYAYISGRGERGVTFEPLRIMERANPSNVRTVGVLNEFRIQDVRDVALNADETRLFLLGRFPDMLLVLSIEDAAGHAPRIQVVRALPLPEGPTMARVIERPGRGPLVAITCSVANALALYDDESGQLATVVTRDMVIQPFGVAVQAPNAAAEGAAVGARMFVTGFGDGRVAVLDLEDVTLPSSLKLRARIGPDQRCLTETPRPAGCPEGGS